MAVAGHEPALAPEHSGGEQLGLPRVLLPTGGAGDGEDRAEGGEEAAEREACARS